MRKLKSIENMALFLLGIYLLNYFWSYHVSSSAIAATSDKRNHFAVIFLTKLFDKKIDELLREISLFGMLCSGLFSFSFLLTKLRPAISLILYLLLVLTIDFNIYIVQLHYAFICVCLIYLAFFNSEDETKNFIHLFNSRFHSKHLILLLFFSSFTISGISKFFFDGWTGGFLLKTIGLREKFFFLLPITKDTPLIYFQIPSFLIGAVEILCFPLYLFRKSRFAIWLASLLLHVFILVGMRNINNISIAMIIIHLFLFESSLFNFNFSYDKRQVAKQ